MSTLGMPGDLLGEAQEAVVTAWRVGGHAVLPSGTELDTSAVRCRVCRHQMALVAQVSSPQGSSASSPPTTTLVFGCIQRGCGRDSGSWAAFSLSQCPAQQEQRDGAADEEAVTRSFVELEAPDGGREQAINAGDVWITGAGEWQDPTEEGASAWSAAAPTYDDLAEQLSRAGLSGSKQQRFAAASGQESWSAESPPAAAQQRSSLLQAPGSRVLLDSPVLPEFGLWQCRESGDQLPALPPGQQEHIAALLRQYEQDSELHQGQEASSSGQAEVWTGENYERLLPKGVSADFMKFKKALDRYPQQCLRYGGTALWPREAGSEQRDPRCRHCSSKLDFTLQLMSPMLSMLEEAAEWLGLEAAARDAMHDWQWLSVAVFTCAQCQGSGALHEDEVVIMNE